MGQHDRLVLNLVLLFACPRNLPDPKFILQGVLINNFAVSLSQFPMDLHADANYPVGFVLVDQLTHISHSRKFVQFVSHFCISAYSRLSERAWRLASMMLSWTPTVPHSSLPLVC